MSKLKTILKPSSPEKPSAMLDDVALRLFLTFDPARPSRRRWRDIQGWQRQIWRDHAATLINEMAEMSSEKMLSAGAVALRPSTAQGVDTRTNHQRARDVFAAMLYEAVEEN